MHLLCIDFMKLDQSKDGKENVLVTTNAFSKFSMTIIMPSEQVKQYQRPWQISGFTLMEYQKGYIVARGKILIIRLYSNCARFTELNNPPQHHIILMAIDHMSNSSTCYKTYQDTAKG